MNRLFQQVAAELITSAVVARIFPSPPHPPPPSSTLQPRLATKYSGRNSERADRSVMDVDHPPVSNLNWLTGAELMADGVASFAGELSPNPAGRWQQVAASHRPCHPTFVFFFSSLSCLNKTNENANLNNSLIKYANEDGGRGWRVEGWWLTASIMHRMMTKDDNQAKRKRTSNFPSSLLLLLPLPPLPPPPPPPSASK